MLTRTHPCGAIAASALALAAGTAASPAFGQDFFYIDAAGGLWSDVPAWSPAGGPPSTINHNAWIGPSPAVTDQIVFLDSDIQLGDLYISDAMGLRTDGHTITAPFGTLTVTGFTQVGGFTASNIYIEGTPAPIDAEFQNITVDDQGLVLLIHEPNVRVFDTVSVGAVSRFTGGGRVDLAKVGGTALVNDGRIAAQAVSTLDIVAGPGAPMLDLDGLSEDGRIQAGRTFVDDETDTTSVLNIAGQVEPFAGRMRITATGEINFDTPGSNTLEPEGEIAFEFTTADHAGRLTGSHWFIEGTVTAASPGAVLDVLTTFRPGSRVNVGFNDNLVATEPMTGTGVTLAVADQAILAVHPDAQLFAVTGEMSGGEIRGGVLRTANDAHTVGETEIRGFGTISASVQNNGTLAGQGGELVLLKVDWDGPAGSGVLEAADGTLRVAFIGPDFTNAGDPDFQGTIRTLPGGLVALDRPLNAQVPSHLDLQGGGILVEKHPFEFNEVPTAIPADIAGTVAVAANTFIDAVTTFEPTAQVTLDAQLELRDTADIFPGATFTAQSPAGSLRIASASTLTPSNGAEINARVDIGGTMNVVDGVGTNTVTGDVFLGGEIVFQSVGATPQQTDLLTGVNVFEARGLITFSTFGFEPGVGETFDILDFEQFVDLGYELALPALTGAKQWDTSTFETDGTLRVVPGPCNAADVGMPYGVLNATDVNAFVSAFTNALPAGDLAAPQGVFNASDINAFVNAFNAGCP
ncbi:MAG: GC-type dockerin domain-anchored protein [Planctomycetota bacterium]